MVGGSGGEQTGSAPLAASVNTVIGAAVVDVRSRAKESGGEGKCGGRVKYPAAQATKIPLAVEQGGDVDARQSGRQRVG